MVSKMYRHFFDKRGATNHFQWLKGKSRPLALAKGPEPDIESRLSIMLMVDGGVVMFRKSSS